MTDYTPTTEQLRDFWTSDGSYQPAAKSYDYDESVAEFNRWLRQVKAEALEPIRALLEEGWLVPCGNHPEGHQHDAGGWPSEALDLIAAIVREGRA